MKATADWWGRVIARRTLARVVEDQKRRRRRGERCREVARRLAVRLASEPGVRRVILFGSLAGSDGLVHTRSDIDLAVEGLAPERFATVSAELAGATSLPLDLLRLEEAGATLQERIETEGEILFVAD